MSEINQRIEDEFKLLDKVNEQVKEMKEKEKEKPTGAGIWWPKVFGYWKKKQKKEEKPT